MTQIEPIFNALLGTVHFVPFLNDLDVEAEAKKNGFDIKVVFKRSPSRKVVKFYRKFSGSVAVQLNLAERECARAGGILPEVYNAHMAEDIMKAIGSKDRYLYVSLDLAKDKKTLTWGNGRIETGWDLCPKRFEGEMLKQNLTQ